MSAEAFIDPNVSIYRLEAVDSRKAAIARPASLAGSGHREWLPHIQVARKCLNTVFSKAEIPLSRERGGISMP